MACVSARAMFLYGGQTLSVACGDIFPWPGEVFPLRWRPWQRGQENPFRHFALRNATSSEGGGLGKEGRFRPHSLTAERIQLLSCKLFALAKASPFRERWHGEAVTERVSSGTNPLSLAALDSAPEGGGLGKEGRFRPHSSTAGRSLPLSCKLFASAKASPFRERWHGEAVTERVPPRLAADFGKRFFHGPAERPSSLESRY